MAAEYASTCYLPTSWCELPLIEKREVNHDSTVYAFGLPEGQSLNLPVCACILMRADGRGRKEGGGKDDWDGSDAVRISSNRHGACDCTLSACPPRCDTPPTAQVRPYTPISDNSMTGRFELLVKRCG